MIFKKSLFIHDYSQQNLYSVIIETLSTENCGKSLREHLGCIHLLNTHKYCDNTRKYCGNTC